MTAEDAPVIVAARRTPIGTRGRALARLRVEELAAPVIRAALVDAGEAMGAPLLVSDVLLGNCMGPGGNPGRVSALAAGLGHETPGGTVDRQCGSGLAAVIDAAAALRAAGAGFIAAREQDGASGVRMTSVRVAGGVESASTAPVRSIEGVAYDRAPFAPEGVADPDMVRAAEDLAEHDGIPRSRQDAHAARSHARARRALAAGRFDAELVPLAGLRHDDAIGGAEPLLPRLPPLFPDGSLTAGTSTRIGDGAAAVVLAPAGTAPGLSIRSAAVVGCDPALPGLGAAPAVQAALRSAGADIGDVRAFEIVEAFAAQSLAVLDRLGIADDDERVCADGGALAIGHPWGASGAVAVVRLFSRLVRSGTPAGTLGVAAASIGGGMGIALVVEVVR